MDRRARPRAGLHPPPRPNLRRQRDDPARSRAGD
jgi:hypothetical protein